MVERDPDHHLMPCTQDLNADPSFNLTANKPPPLQGRGAAAVGAEWHTEGSEYIV